MSVEGSTVNLSVDSYAVCREPQADAAGDPVAVQELAPLIAESENITVTRSRGTVIVAGKGGRVSLGVPELDEPEIDTAAVDLAALVAYLQMDCTERQLEVAQQRLEVTKARVEADHEATLAQGEELIEVAAEAEEKAHRRKIFGNILSHISALQWLYFAVMSLNPLNVLYVAAATKACDKLKEGFSKLNHEVIGALGDALESVVLKVCDILNDWFGVELSDKDKEVIETVTHILAGFKIILGEILLSILIFHKLPAGAGKGAGQGATVSLAEKMAELMSNRTAQRVVNGVMIGSASINAASQVLNAATQRDMAMTQADLEEMKSYLRELQTRLQDEEETSEDLLRMMYQCSESVAEILASQAEVDVAITRQIA